MTLLRSIAALVVLALAPSAAAAEIVAMLNYESKAVLHVMDLKRFPYRLTAVPVPECTVPEGVVVSPDNKTWFLTCMGSHNVVVGDAVTDRPLKVIDVAQGKAVKSITTLKDAGYNPNCIVLLPPR